MKGFVVLPRRCVVGRTFSWFGRNRRLAKDFETSPKPSPPSSPSLLSRSPSGGLHGRRPDLNNAGRDDGAGPAVGGERLISNRSADLRRASSSDADAPMD